MEKPKVAILASTPDTAQAVTKQLRNMFINSVDFKTYDFQTIEAANISISSRLVLITSNHISAQAKHYISPETDIVIANRVINVDTIHNLYALPEGSRVLLVNNLEETTLEAIKQLLAVGLNHLKYFPYYPEIPDYQADCPYAVSFDEVDLIPQGSYVKVINLGSRPVDITTIIDLATRLGIYDKVKNILSAAFLKPSLDMSQNIYKQLKTNEFLKNKQTFILNMFEAGILTLNDKYELDYYNAKAEKILKIVKKQSAYLQMIITKAKKERKFFIAIENNNYYVEVNKYTSNQATEFIIAIDGTTKIETIEKDYRIYSHQKGFFADYTFDKIFYRSAVMEKILLQAKQFAKSSSNILVEGESGSGKEMFAQAIHNESERRQYPFVAVNFAALNEALCESELFGYEEGSFTGARKGGKKGLFEVAHKGTIFLDEIGDAPISIQKKILRVLQERRVMPVGSNQLIPVDVRVIAATNQNLWEMVTQKSFRQDLYYRLKVLPLFLSPLRERQEDILPTFLYFLTQIFRVNEKKSKDIVDSGEIKKLLLAHQWPGNIRELRNVAEYVSNFISFEMDWVAELRNILFNNATEQNPQLKSTVATLEQYGPAEELLRVLKSMNRPPYVFGRRELEQILSPMTQSTIKRHLAILKKTGLIQSKTGYGSYLLDAGKRLCANNHT